MALLRRCYRLLGGGNTNPTIKPYTHPSRFSPGGKSNMFSYKGPRHVKVAGIWDEQALYAAAYQDLLKGVHVIVGTPEYLSKIASPENLVVAKTSEAGEQGEYPARTFLEASWKFP